jgi:hypothetical protein
MDATGNLGFSLPSPAMIAGGLLFSILGLAAYRYGKHGELPAFRWGGAALMIYPYFISQTWLLYAVGAAICLGIYTWHRSG